MIIFRTTTRSLRFSSILYLSSEITESFERAHALTKEVKSSFHGKISPILNRILHLSGTDPFTSFPGADQGVLRENLKFEESLELLDSYLSLSIKEKSISKIASRLSD